MRLCSTEPDELKAARNEAIRFASDLEDIVVVHVVEDGGPLTTTSRMTLPEAVAFYDRLTATRIAQGGAMLCRVLHDVDSQFPPDLLLPGDK